MSEDANLTIGNFWTTVGVASVAVVIAGIALAYFLEHWRNIARKMDSVGGYEEWRIQEMAKRIQELEQNIDSMEKKEEFTKIKIDHSAALLEQKRHESLASVSKTNLNLSRRHWASTAVKKRVKKIGGTPKKDEEAAVADPVPVVGTGTHVQFEVNVRPEGFS